MVTSRAVFKGSLSPPQSETRLVLILDLFWINRSECVLLCRAPKSVGEGATESFIVLSNGFQDKPFLMEYFIVSLRSHDLKSAVLVDICS